MAQITATAQPRDTAGRARRRAARRVRLAAFTAAVVTGLGLVASVGGSVTKALNGGTSWSAKVGPGNALVSELLVQLRSGALPRAASVPG